MTTSEAAVAERLERVSAELAARGVQDLALEVSEAVRALRGETVPEPPGGVLTTGEAASLLGIRSLNTIKRWALEGRLQGFRRGHRVLVSRASVERMLRAPEVAEQRRVEHDLESALEPFDAPDGVELPTTTTAAGRTPWRAGERTRR